MTIVSLSCLSRTIAVYLLEIRRWILKAAHLSTDLVGVDGDPTQSFRLPIRQHVHGLFRDIKSLCSGVDGKDVDGITIVRERPARAAGRGIPAPYSGCTSDQREMREGAKVGVAFGDQPVFTIGAGYVVERVAVVVVHVVVRDSGAGGEGWCCKCSKGDERQDELESELHVVNVIRVRKSDFAMIEVNNRLAFYTSVPLTRKVFITRCRSPGRRITRDVSEPVVDHFSFCTSASYRDHVTKASASRGESGGEMKRVITSTTSKVLSSIRYAGCTARRSYILYVRKWMLKRRFRFTTVLPLQVCDVSSRYMLDPVAQVSIGVRWVDGMERATRTMLIHYPLARLS